MNVAEDSRYSKWVSAGRPNSCKYNGADFRRILSNFAGLHARTDLQYEGRRHERGTRFVEGL